MSSRQSKENQIPPPLFALKVFFLSVLAPIFLIFQAQANPTPATAPVWRLSQLYRDTVGEAEAVQAQVERKNQAEEIKSQATGAFLPTLTGVATYFQNDSAASAGAASALAPSTLKNARIVGRQVLFAGGSEYAFLSRSKRSLEANQAEVDASRLQYMSDLAQAYYDTLLRQAEWQHASTELGLYDDQISELRSRVKIGRSKTSDLLSVQAARAASLAAVRAAETALLQSKLSLARLARIPLPFNLTVELPTTELPPLEVYLKKAEQSPSLVAARKRREMVEKDIGVQRGGHFPTLDLSGNYFLHREGFNANSKWDATLTLTLPIFEGGARQSLVRQAASAYREAEVTTTLLERARDTEIRSLHQSILSSREELRAFSEAVELAKKSYDRVQRDYQYGLSTHLDLLNSLQTLTAAKRNLDRARFQRSLDRVRLETSAGLLPQLETQSTPPAGG